LGARNVDIAEALRVTLSTVKRHVEHLLLKLNVENRPDEPTNEQIDELADEARLLEGVDRIIGADQDPGM
jgi:DNA-binding NarL/FixJ family response regulator